MGTSPLRDLHDEAVAAQQIGDALDHRRIVFDDS